jgi:hypothetical protein
LTIKPNTIDYAVFVKVSADNVKVLRKADVFRVLSETPAKHREGLATYIISRRADLADEVREVLSEVTNGSES